MRLLENDAEIAGYRIETLLGRGGMSEVYRASHPRLGTSIALKLLARELADDDLFRERFVRESQLAASLNHPNVIPIFDTGEWDGLQYIAMRYVDGPDLKQLLGRDGPLSLPHAVAIVRQAGAALDCAHDKGLLHRDVKPGNILIDEQGSEDEFGHVYLSDFGVAKHSESRSGLTSTGHFVGTIDYIAPEQIEGKALERTTDVYSLGCVFFECLAGRPPFDRDSDVSMIYAHLLEPPPSLHELRPDLPAELDAVVAKAMAKAPQERFATCREFTTAARATFEPTTGSRPATVVSTGNGPAPTVAAGAASIKPPADPTRIATGAAPPTALAGSPGEADTAVPRVAQTAAPAPVPAPPTALSTEGAEAETAAKDGRWRSKRLAIAVVVTLLLGGVAAAGATMIGSSGKKSKPTVGHSPSGSGGKTSHNGQGGGGGGPIGSGGTPGVPTQQKAHGSGRPGLKRLKTHLHARAHSRRGVNPPPPPPSGGDRRRGSTAPPPPPPPSGDRRRGATPPPPPPPPPSGNRRNR